MNYSAPVVDQRPKVFCDDSRRIDRKNADSRPRMSDGLPLRCGDRLETRRKSPPINAHYRWNQRDRRTPLRISCSWP